MEKLAPSQLLNGYYHHYIKLMGVMLFAASLGACSFDEHKPAPRPRGENQDIIYNTGESSSPTSTGPSAPVSAPGAMGGGIGGGAMGGVSGVTIR